MAATAAGDSGWTRMPASGYTRRISANAVALNSSWTTQAPRHSNISAPVLALMYAPRCWSGAQRIFSSFAVRCSTIRNPTLDVTTQSERALTRADVFAYTTTVRSGWSATNASNSSGGHPISNEHSAAKFGIKTRFCGARILAVSPMKRTPATTKVGAG